jgi:GGDEF domain-containing protein
VTEQTYYRWKREYGGLRTDQAKRRQAVEHVHGVRGIEEAMNVAEMLWRRAAEPIPTAAGPIAIALSIGVTIANPNESTDALLARADDAMCQAKNRGRNQVVAIAATGVLPVS